MAKKKTSHQPRQRYTARAADLKILGCVAVSEAEALQNARKLYDAASVEAHAADHPNGKAAEPAAPHGPKGRAAKSKRTEAGAVVSYYMVRRRLARWRVVVAGAIHRQSLHIVALSRFFLVDQRRGILRFCAVGRQDIHRCDDLAVGVHGHID